MRNLPEFVIGFWGAALLGAIVVPLNSWWTGAELGYALDNAGARVAFLDDDRLARVVDHGRPDGVQLVGVRTDRADADAAFAELVAGRTPPRRRRRGARTRRPGDHPLHVGHHGSPEGRARHQPRAPAQHLEHGVRWRTRSDHHRARTGTRPPARHPRRATDVPHRWDRRDHRQPDGWLQDPDHAQVGSRTGPPARGRRRTDRVRGCAGDRAPDHRVPRARRPRPRRARLPHGRRGGPARSAA